MKIRHRFAAAALVLMPVACASQPKVETQMNSLLSRASGHYIGTNGLWYMSPDPEESGTEIDVTSSRISYTWQYRGEPQTGVMDFAGEGETVTATWSDTWHAKEPMKCVGERTDDRIEVTCKYGEGWSWRTEVTLPTADELLVEMFNIHPDGKEEIAVRMRGARQ